MALQFRRTILHNRTIRDIACENAPTGLAELENRATRRCNAGFANSLGGQTGDYPIMPIVSLYPSQVKFDRIGSRGLTVLQKTGLYMDERIMRRLPSDRSSVASGDSP